MIKLVFLWLILFPCVAYAQETFVQMEKGDRAPFDGVLMSHSGMAKLLSEKDAELSKCMVEKKHLKENYVVQKERYEAVKTAELEISSQKYESIIKLKDEEIKYLQKMNNIKKKGLFEMFNTSSFWWGVGIGFVTSTVTTIAILYSVK